MILLVVFVLFYFIMNYTTTGRAIYAVGGNPESARLSGINVLTTKIIVFASVQCMCVIAKIINSAQVIAGSYSFGRGAGGGRHLRGCHWRNEHALAASARFGVR